MTHSALDALFEIRGQHDFDFDDLEKMTVRQIEQGMYVARRRPTSSPRFGTAHLNMYYCLAAALVNRGLTVQAFTDQSFRDRRIRALYERIEIIADPELSKDYPAKGRPTVVQVELKNGTRLTAKIDIPRGDPALPLTQDEVFRKFYANSLASLQEESIHEISTTVFNLEKFDTLSGLFNKLGNTR
jgi:2-methylcitrate dehydratase